MTCRPPVHSAGCPGNCQAHPAPVSAPSHPHPNRNLVRLACGCPPQIPFPMLRVLGEHIDRVLCEVHGWQPLAPELKKKKRVQKNPGQEKMIPF